MKTSILLKSHALFLLISFASLSTESHDPYLEGKKGNSSYERSTYAKVELDFEQAEAVFGL